MTLWYLTILLPWSPGQSIYVAQAGFDKNPYPWSPTQNHYNEHLRFNISINCEISLLVTIAHPEYLLFSCVCFLFCLQTMLLVF